MRCLEHLETIENLPDRAKCKGCDEWFEEEELNEDGFCCSECETLFYNPSLLKM